MKERSREEPEHNTTQLLSLHTFPVHTGIQQFGRWLISYQFSIKMKPSVCLVCLKAFNSANLTPEEDGTRSCAVSLLTRFLKFAENYLQVSSVTTQQLLLNEGGNCGKEAFCEKCELSVINPICKVYLELLSAQLRLSSELEHLGKLLDNSRVSGSDKLRVLNINALSHQLGIRSLSQVEGFRTSLAQKCVLKREQALPNVLLTALYEEGQTNLSENDDSSIDDNFEKVWADPLSLEVDDGNSLDLEQDELIANSVTGQRQTRESGEGVVRQASESTPVIIGTSVIRLETFHDSNPEFIFENENDEEFEDFEDSPSELSPGQVVIPVADRTGIHVNERRCPKCSKVFIGESQYHNHYLYHHVPVNCKSCGIMISSKKLLREHFIRNHRKRGNYPCQMCSRAYETPFKLNLHVRRLHRPIEQRHECPHCKLTFNLNADLKHHVEAKHYPGSYRCPHCPDSKVFTATTNKYLNSHIRKHHPQKRGTSQASQQVLSLV